MRRVLLASFTLLLLGAEADPWRGPRRRMVEETIEHPRDGRPPVSDPLVLAAMRKVERHRFVPEDLRSFAYEDRPLPIGYEQTVSQPYMVALMTALAAPRPDHVVLEIGTGSGYQAAVLAEIVQQVYTVEIVEALAKRAAVDLATAGYDNVSVRAGDGYLGWPERAPFDAVIVTAAPDHVPEPLVAQLKVGGRLVIPVGRQSWWGQELVVLEKRADGTTERTQVMRVRFVPLTREQIDRRPPP